MTRGNQLKYAIKEKGLTLQEAATILGIARQTLSINLDKHELDYFFEKNLIEKLDLFVPLPPASNLNDDQSQYGISKDDLINSLRQTIASQQDVIDMQKLRIAQLEDQVNATPARKSA